MVSFDMRPVSQSAHEDAPVSLVYFPDSHTLQDVIPEFPWIRPGTHEEQVVEPELDANVPIEHFVHDVRPLPTPE